MKTISLLFIILIGYFTLYAQSGGSAKLTDEEINELSSKLAMKLLLNDSQKASIKEILKTYSSELTNINSGSGKSIYKNKQELISALDSKIKSFLDSKQIMKFSVLEKEWWTSVDEENSD
jgi:hypothetical protein